VTSLNRLMAPTSRAVSLDEFKLGLKIDTTYLCDKAASAEDASLAMVLDAAIDECQERLRRAILPQTWQLTLDGFPAMMGLPYPRARAVTVEYLDAAATWVTLSAHQYTLVDAAPAVLVPAYQAAWPTPLAHVDVVRVTFQCWTWALPADVPAGIKQWIIARAAELRQQVERSGPVVMNAHTFIDALLGMYIVPDYQYRNGFFV